MKIHKLKIFGLLLNLIIIIAFIPAVLFLIFKFSWVLSDRWLKNMDGFIFMHTTTSYGNTKTQNDYKDKPF